MASAQEILQAALQSGDQELLELAMKMQPQNQDQTTDVGITSGLTATQKTAFEGSAQRPNWCDEQTPIKKAKVCRTLGANPTDASLPDL